MVASPRFGRLITAMVTPFTSAGDLDLDRAGQLANRLLDQGTEGLVVCGTTGESPTVFYDQKIELFRAVIDAAGSRAPIIANAGDNCTDDSVAFARDVVKLGVDAIMCVVPYYNKPPQEGLYRHFSAIASAVEVPVILYNVPSRTVVSIDPDTVLRLANDHENIVAIKQALGDLEQARTIISGAPEGFEMLSGDDAITLSLMREGATGVISVMSHVAGPGMRALIEAHLSGDDARADLLQEVLEPLADALFMTANPIMVKAALAELGFPVGGVRLPLVNAEPAQVAALNAVMDDAFLQLDAMGVPVPR